MTKPPISPTEIVLVPPEPGSGALAPAEVYVTAENDFLDYVGLLDPSGTFRLDGSYRSVEVDRDDETVGRRQMADLINRYAR